MCADFVGTTCTEFDVLVRDFTGELSIGDSIVFEHVGAYTLVTSRQFITPRLGVYDLHTLECLRREVIPVQCRREYIQTLPVVSVHPGE